MSSTAESTLLYQGEDLEPLLACAAALARRKGWRITRQTERGLDCTIPMSWRSWGFGLGLTTVIEALPHPFYVVDTRTHEILAANAAAMEGRDWVPGLTCHELTHHQTLPARARTIPARSRSFGRASNRRWSSTSTTTARAVPASSRCTATRSWMSAAR